MKLFEIKHLTENYRKGIFRDEALEYIRNHCRDAMENLDRPIVRGMVRGDEFQIVTGSDGGRKSAHTKNYYTEILDAALPGEFPRRSKSVICGNWANKSYAGNYGTLYVMLPKDGTEIGVCEYGDIWETDITLGGETQRMNEWNATFNYAKIPDTSYSNMMRAMRDLLDTDDEELAGDPDGGDKLALKKILMNIEEENGGDFESVIEMEYANHFTATTTSDYDSFNEGHEEKEVWFSDPAIAIRYDMWLDLRDELQE